MHNNYGESERTPFSSNGLNYFLSIFRSQLLSLTRMFGVSLFPVFSKHATTHDVLARSDIKRADWSGNANAGDTPTFNNLQMYPSNNVQKLARLVRYVSISLPKLTPTLCYLGVSRSFMSPVMFLRPRFILVSFLAFQLMSSLPGASASGSVKSQGVNCCIKASLSAFSSSTDCLT